MTFTQEWFGIAEVPQFIVKVCEPLIDAFAECAIEARYVGLHEIYEGNITACRSNHAIFVISRTATAVSGSFARYRSDSQ